MRTMDGTMRTTVQTEKSVTDIVIIINNSPGLPLQRSAGGSATETLNRDHRQLYKGLVEDHCPDQLLLEHIIEDLHHHPRLLARIGIVHFNRLDRSLNTPQQNDGARSCRLYQSIIRLLDLSQHLSNTQKTPVIQSMRHA